MFTTCKSPKDLQARLERTLDNLPDVHKKVFSDVEESIIRKYYAKKGPKQIAKVLGKNPRQIISKANLMGLVRS